MIKNLTTGATEQAFTFDSCQYLWVKNTGDSTVYISPYSNIVAGADNVATLVSGDAVRIPAPANKLYTLGQGTLAVHAINTEESPFKSAGKGGGSGDGTTKYIGTTTTALGNGSTTNPITVNGESYMAQFGDIVVYNYTEFIFDGTAWGEFGRQYDSTPTSGSANAVTSTGIYELIHEGTGLGAVAIRSNTIASGTFSTTMGDTTTASGNFSTAMGSNTTASGNFSTAMGGYNTASGNFSTAMGGNTTASGACSTTMGEATIADQACMTAIGKYNSPSSGDLFNIGNGTDYNARSNIVEVSSTYLNVNGAIKANGVAYITPYTTMPTVTATMVGQIAQYMGVTNSTYTRGWFYEAVSDGESDPTYSWEAINFPKVPGGGDALTATQNGVYVPTSAYGYSSVTVNVPFYARTDAALADVSTVEGDEMHIEPTAGTSYYPRLFLMSTPYPNTEQEGPTDRGKYFAPTDGNYTVQPYIDIIDKATGQSVTGYPQQVHTSASFGINSGGYCRVKSWSYANDKISVTTTRYNTTYQAPIDDTYATQNDVDDWCSAYATGPYAIYDDLAKGTCGTNATWVLYKSGQLVISGTGTVTDGGWDDTKVVDVLVGEGITRLGQELFRGNTAIRTAHLPSTLGYIDQGAFRESTLTSIVISEGTYYFANRCFRSCSNLTSITLPSSTTSIQQYAFNPSGLQTVTVLATTPPAFGTSASNTAFPTTATIYVPYDSVNAYKTAWSNYASQIQPIVTVGDMIDISQNSYTLTSKDLTAVGIRIYGDSTGVGTMYNDYRAAISVSPSPDISPQFNAATFLTGGVLHEDEYVDVFTYAADAYTTPLTGVIADAMDACTTSTVFTGGSSSMYIHKFSFIFKGTTNAQSTRTLATDPIVRSTLSVISDTPNIEIEDE